MGLFHKRKGSKAEENLKITKEDKHHFKQRSAEVHDPVLSAMNEQQPYEIGASTNLDTVSPEFQSRDIHGNPIVNPDLNNPTRDRNERPLATIRGFEYFATGDNSYLEQMNKDNYAWDDRKFTRESGFDWTTKQYRTREPVYDEYTGQYYDQPYDQQQIQQQNAERKIISLSGGGNEHEFDNIPGFNGNKNDKKKKKATKKSGGLFKKKNKN